jgi:hypothetical protein
MPNEKASKAIVALGRGHLTGQPPLILVLNVRSIAPLVNADEKFVLTVSPYEGRNIEFSRVPAALRIAHLYSIDPQVECAINTVKPEAYVWLLAPGSRDGKFTPIGAGRVL